MRIKRLELTAFGPFRGRTLVFASKGPGLHLIYGANEAGKSSSLRGLKALLYGFHPQTPDNFLHNYDQLLVQGCLENSDGQTLVFQRRKKRVNDLLDANGAPLDMSRLDAFLHGVEADIFSSLYGIDHNRLVLGGKEILAQQGEVGKILFAAGAGLSSLRSVMEQLEQEASELFKPNGSKPELNQAIKHCKELQQEVKALSLAPRQWKELQKELQEAQTERARLERERAEKNKELQRIERLQQAMPELAALELWHDQVAALGKITILPPDTAEKHCQVERHIEEAAAQLQQSSEYCKRVAEKQEKIPLNTALLEQTDVVDDLHQRLGAYRKGQKDRPERNGMRISLRKEAAILLRQIRPDMALEDIETLRPMLARKKTIQTLSARFAAISQHISQTRKQIKVSTQEVQEVTTRLAAIPETTDVHALKLAIKLAHKAGDIDTQNTKASKELAQSRKECLRELRRIGLWTGDLAGLVDLPLPLAETIQHFEQEYNAIDEAKRVLEKDRKKATKELRSLTTELKKLAYGGDVPTEQSLCRTREKREKGWQLLRRQWLHREDISAESQAYNPEKPLPEAYEKLVQQADILADRLRNEADRVAHGANLRAQKEQQQELLAECDTLAGELEHRENIWRDAWTGVWQPLGIEPRTPREMNGWFTAMDKLRYRVHDLLKKERDWHHEQKRQKDLRHRLLQELAALGATDSPSEETVGPALVLAETWANQADQRQTEQKLLLEKQKKAQKALEQANVEYEEAQERLVIWQNQWDQAISGLGLKRNISPQEAMDHLETLQTCLDTVKQADDLQKRIDGIDRDARALEKEVQVLLRKTAPDLVTLPVDQAILQLKGLHRQAQKDNTLYEQLSVELESLQTEVALAEKTLRKAKTQREELLKAAGCTQPGELRPIIDTFQKYQELQEKITATQANLTRIGAGTPVEELAAQARTVHRDALPGQIEALRQDIEATIHPAINAVSQKIGEITNKLEVMDGGAKAAETTEKMEQELARIRRLAHHYTRLKLSSRILQQEIERYRETHQGPVLRAAARYFKELTLHSFADLKTDVNEKGEAVLVGIRPDGKWTAVSGMSDGTRDQLYLALRLATLEWRLETSEPMPFIVDDILINFDDNRTQATLKALARLGRKNQIILFTHHQQLVHDAKQLETEEEVVIHTL